MISYKGYLKDTGELFDDGEGENYAIRFGSAQVMGPIEDAIRTMEIGEEREIDVPAKDAYGIYDERAVETVMVKDIPNGQNLPVGEYILWRNPLSEKPLPVKVLSVKNGIARFDFNHPLAGRDLTYRVKLIERA